jgi:RNA-binding protein
MIQRTEDRGDDKKNVESQNNETQHIMLTPKQIKQFKAQAHSLKPIVIIGNQGLTAAVHAEIDRALNDHELIKIRINTEEKLHRQQITEEICATEKAELVQMIGKISSIYRKCVG